MQPAQIPEAFLKPENRPLSAVAIGETVKVDYTEVLIRRGDRATYVNPRAKAYQDGIAPLRFVVERTPKGVVLFLPEPCQPKPRFLTVERIPPDAIPVVEIRMESKP